MTNKSVKPNENLISLGLSQCFDSSFQPTIKSEVNRLIYFALLLTQETKIVNLKTESQPS